MSRSSIPNTLFAFGLNHRTAPVEVREKLYVQESEIPAFLDLASRSLTECFIVSTCNRTEIYGVTDSADFDLNEYKAMLVDFKGAGDEVKDEHFFDLISCAASQQLFNVATSIDSKVIGDLQILGQLRDAYMISADLRATGRILNQLLQRSLKLGKRVYSETSIHQGAISVSLAAVELAVEIVGTLRGKKALVIGAGEMARLTAEALTNKKVGRLLVANRTQSRAEQMLRSLPASHTTDLELLDFGEFKERLNEVDLLITTTSSDEPILYKEDFCSINKDLLIIDIAVPRDVDTAVTEHPNVTVKNIDDLHSIIEENREKRLRDLPKVKRMIAAEMVEFLTWYYTQPLMPAYEKTGVKPPHEQAKEILKIKEFLSRNISEVHKLFKQSGGSFREDLRLHLDLIERLKRKKASEFGEAAR